MRAASDLSSIFGEALLAHRGGQIEKARTLYETVLKEDPDNADALGMYGVLAHQIGSNDVALEALSQAAKLQPGSPDIQLNMGNVLRAVGKLDDAVKSTRLAIALKPDFLPAYNNLGLMLLELGRTNEAEEILLKAVGFAPNYADVFDSLGLIAQQRGLYAEAVKYHQEAISRDGAFAEAHRNLGTALQSLQRSKEAVESFRRAIALSPDDFSITMSLANALSRIGELNKALTHYQKAIQLNTQSPIAHLDFGRALQECGRLNEALAQYDEAIRLNPDSAESYRNKGIAYLMKQSSDLAYHSFAKTLQLNHGGPWWNAERFDANRVSGALKERDLRASTFRLRDAADQIEYLVERKILHMSYREMVARYREVLEEIEQSAWDGSTSTLNSEQRLKIGQFIDRVIRYVDSPRLVGVAINPDHDYSELENSYLTSPTSVTTFDNFLTPEALKALRDFVLENTIFFNFSEARFVGSDLSSGFNCGLLYQIAEELKLKFPRVLGDHTLTNAWVYRHSAQSVGVEAHSDEGKVTFNFYISPDEANLVPDHGGMVVYAKEQPYDWDWNLINHHKYRPDIKSKIKEFLDTAEPISIPHKQNRAVLFNSNLFHRSELFHFKDGFSTRRMNVTFLFGKRNEY